ncbi:HECT domain containing ubiquitin ligase [Klebsormidium nitens]|uniref:HECT-type E3 ubiquitin transferase n=1 Tax=Klebsormidium nitens TaxID=105231 RepID=A0A1Y1HSY4_KLENI|nr:HECT domain containing ubiquitin ligase [Klebsormidium nitens]|eukprot:GAQ80111.1 HECT domain containing ubiquitin ligase [Klebsormidium nitens]
MEPNRKGAGGPRETSESIAENAVHKLPMRLSRTMSDQARRKAEKDVRESESKDKPAAKLTSGKAQRVLKDVTNQRSAKHATELTKKASQQSRPVPIAAIGAGQAPNVHHATTASAKEAEVAVADTSEYKPESASLLGRPQEADSSQGPVEKGTTSVLPEGRSGLPFNTEESPGIQVLEEGAGANADTERKADSKASMKSKALPLPVAVPLSDTRREQRKLAAAMKVFEQLEQQRLQQQEMERKAQAKTLHVQQLLRKAMKGWKSIRSNASLPANPSSLGVDEAGKLQAPGPSEQQTVNNDIKGKQKVEEITSEEGQVNHRPRQTGKRNGSTSMPAPKVEVQSPSQAFGSAAVAIVDQSIQELKEKRKKRVRTRGRQKQVERVRMVESIIALFSELKGEELLDDFAVLFKGEEGMDAGGLTAELFYLFLLSCLRAEGPGTDKKEWANTFLQIGKVFIKSILDQVPLPRRLASTFFKFVLDCPLDLDDLGSFDPQLKRSYESILAATSEDLDNMCLSFDSVGDPADAVTSENRAQFVDQMVYEKLLGCRLEALEALREGMSQIGPLYDQLRTLSPAALEDRMCGTEVMNGRDVAVFLHFPPGELSQAVHKEQLLALLDAWDQSTLSDFLKFTTGLCVLPIGGLKNPDASPKHMIKVVSCTCASCKKRSGPAKSPCTLLPQASTCFWTLRLPVCSIAEELEKKLLVAFKWGNGSFGQL